MYVWTTRGKQRVFRGDPDKQSRPSIDLVDSNVGQLPQAEMGRPTADVHIHGVGLHRAEDLTDSESH